MNVQNNSEVIICTKCNGTGILEDKEQRGPISKCHQLECYMCDGTGRQLKITHIKYQPFIPVEL